MKLLAWHLTNKGRLLEIFEIDQETRKARLLMSLGAKFGMSEEEALKFFNNNYPRDKSSVGAAADQLGIPTRKR